jgi:hypothetical protein
MLNSTNYNIISQEWTSSPDDRDTVKTRNKVEV